MQCKFDESICGRVVGLGYVYYVNGIKLDEPRLLTAEDFVEVEDPMIETITADKLGLRGHYTYAEAKTAAVKLYYSNDDQIALMINYQFDSETYRDAYFEMQSWREIAARIATRLISRKEDGNDNL